MPLIAVTSGTLSKTSVRPRHQEDHYDVIIKLLDCIRDLVKHVELFFQNVAYSRMVHCEEMS
jgi:hypothetical protein